jgi:hypothetical protein
MTAPYRLRAPRPVSAVDDVLGPVTRSYHVAARSSARVAIIPFVVLLAYMLWLGREGQLSTWFSSTFSAVTVGMLFALSIAVIGHTTSVGGAEVVRVHANGILDLRGGSKAVRWDEIESLTTVWSPDGSGVLRHVLRAKDGARVSLGRSIADVTDLVDQIRARMIDHAVPALRARIDDGGELRFGALAASDRGVSLGPSVFPWDEVRDIEADDDGHVVVRGEGGVRLAAAKLDEVPNAFLLAELTHARARAKKG